jgi:viologen exporter family transport system permease protein
LAERATVKHRISFMRQFLRNYLVLTKRSLAVSLEYRMWMLIWMLSASFPLVMLAVWLSLAENGPIGGYTAGDFVGYFLLSFYMRQMTSVWVAWDLDYDIRHGHLSVKLLHPVHPIHDYISNNLADKVLRGLIFTPIVILVAALFPQVTYVVTPLNIFLFVLALCGAWLMRFMFQFILGLFAFWFSQALVLTDVFWMLFLLFGGGVAPIPLLPEPLRTIALILPFRLMMAFPIEIMLGQLTTDMMAINFALMLMWIFVLLVAHRVIWRRGIRQFSAFGA